MQNPVTKLGIVGSITYFPEREVLRAVTSDGNVHEVQGVSSQRVEAARPFSPASIERLVDESLPWQLVSGKPHAPMKRARPVGPPTLGATRKRKRLTGRFQSPLGLVQSVTYDRNAGRLRLTLAEGGCYECRPLALENARSLAPVRNRSQFDRLFDVGQEWQRLDETA